MEQGPAAQPADPQAPPPSVEAPIPPPQQLPPPPPAATAQAPVAPAPVAAPAGQWVYTQQYGWVFMPYAESYTYVPANGTGEPLAYVYYPNYGWRWVVAPWVWGIGPWPHFAHAPARFVWYQRGWWRSPARWHFQPAPVHTEHSTRGIREAPHRGGERERARGEHRGER